MKRVGKLEEIGCQIVARSRKNENPRGDSGREIFFCEQAKKLVKHL
jgi:hypothetical protein